MQKRGVIYLIYFIFQLIPFTYTCAQKNAAKKHECQESNDTDVCILYEIPKKFIPVSKTPLDVTYLIIKGSLRPVINTTICSEFPNIERFNAGGQSIEVIIDGAFAGCTKMRELFLGANQISALDKDTFKNNTQLTHLWLYMNELESLPEELFSHQQKLEHLYLSSNNLHEFSVEVYRYLGNLRILTLHTNELTDLDALTLVKHMPHLKEIQLRTNRFECKRLKVLMRIFEARNIFLGRNGGSNDRYLYTYYKNFECIRYFRNRNYKKWSE